MTQDRIDSFTIKSDALKEGAPPLRVLSFRGREEISTPFEYEIDLLCDNPALDFDALLENPASLGIRQRAQKGRGFITLKIHGIFRSFEQKETTPQGTRYRAVLVPALWKSGLQMQSQVHTDLSVVEIIEAELTKAGFTENDFELRLEAANYPKREYTVQYEESDLNFLQRLCADVGIFYYFVHENDRAKVIFADKSDHYASLNGHSTVPFRPDSIGGNNSVDPENWREESIHSVSLSQDLVPAQVTLRDYNWRTPQVSLKNDQATVERSAFGTYYEYGSHFKNETEGKFLARVRAEEIEARQVRLEGAGNTRSFRAGALFELEEHPRGSLNDTWLLTRVECEGSQPTDTDAEAGAQFETRFTAMPGSREFRPPQWENRPRIDGLLSAHIDAGGSGEYAEIDDHGRYKVKLPFDLTDRCDGKASRFIRMAQPYAGGEMGMHFPLHKGVEVLLAHVNGDPDRPIIIGAVPNPDTASPVTGSNQTQCKVQTGGGNSMTFEDTADGQRIVVRSPKVNTFFSMGDSFA